MALRYSNAIANVRRPQALQQQRCYRRAVSGAPRPVFAAASQHEQQHLEQQQQQQQQQQQHKQEQRSSALRLALSNAALALCAPLAASAAAVDGFVDAPQPEYSYPAADDPVVTVLFTVATGLLSVVTLGVIYLAVVSWMDSRQEKADREGSPFSSAIAAGAGDDDAAEKERKQRARRVVDKSKGFGQ